MTRTRLAICAICVLAIGAAASALATPGDGKVRVPNLVGKSAADANTALHAAGFENDLEVDSASLDCGEHPPKVDERAILCQKPAAGELAARSIYVYAVTYHDPRPRDILDRKQLESLIGLTVDQAKAKLKDMHFDGPIDVRRNSTYVAACGIGKVCSTEPMTAVNLHDNLRLFVNPEAEISAPP